MVVKNIKAVFNHNRITLLYVLLFLGLLLFLHFQLDIGEFSTDDFQTEKWGATQNYFQWISWLYHTWSGRVTTDTTSFFVLKAGINYWRIINPVMIVLLVYAIARIISGSFKNKGFAFAFVASFLLLGLIYPNLSYDSLFGTVSSFYYLWPLSLGLYSLIPLFDRVFRREDTQLNISHILAGFFASMGQEQISLFLFVFSCAAIFLLFLKDKQVKRNDILYAATLLVGLMVLLLAPGNKVRFVEAVNVCFPGFDHFSIFTKVINGVKYFLESALIESRNIVFALFITLLFSTLSLLKKTKNVFLFFSASLLTFSTLVLLLYQLEVQDRGWAFLKYFFAYDKLLSYDKVSRTASVFLSSTAVFSALFWLLIFFIIVPFLIYQFFKANSNQGLANLLVYYGALASLTVMFFTPTIFCSGYRPRFLLNVLFILLSVNLVANTLPKEYMTEQRIVLIVMIVPLVAFSAYYPVFNRYSLSKEVTFSELRAAKNSTCGIDSIERKYQDVLVTIQGWESEKNGSSGDKILVMLNSDKNAYAFSTFLLTSSSELNKIIAPIDTARLKPGKYQIGLGVEPPGQKAVDVCYPAAQLEIK